MVRPVNPEQPISPRGKASPSPKSASPSLKPYTSSEESSPRSLAGRVTPLEGTRSSSPAKAVIEAGKFLKTYKTGQKEAVQANLEKADVTELWQLFSAAVRDRDFAFAFEIYAQAIEQPPSEDLTLFMHDAFIMMASIDPNEIGKAVVAAIKNDNLPLAQRLAEGHRIPKQYQKEAIIAADAKDRLSVRNLFSENPTPPPADGV